MTVSQKCHWLRAASCRVDLWCNDHAGLRSILQSYYSSLQQWTWAGRHAWRATPHADGKRCLSMKTSRSVPRSMHDPPMGQPTRRRVGSCIQPARQPSQLCLYAHLRCWDDRRYQKAGVPDCVQRQVCLTGCVSQNGNDVSIDSVACRIADTGNARIKGKGVLGAGHREVKDTE